MRLAPLLALTAVPAEAAINPCYLDQMVAEAPTAVQVTEQAVDGPDAEGGCTLAGTVARSFRGATVQGEPLATTFACANPAGLVGGTTYHEARDVARAGAVELHLDADGLPAAYGWGLLPLDAPTDAPAFPFDHLPADGTC